MIRRITIPVDTERQLAASAALLDYSTDPSQANLNRAREALGRALVPDGSAMGSVDQERVFEVAGALIPDVAAQRGD